MVKSKIQTEYNDYDITAVGLVLSGEIHNLCYDLNCDKSEYPKGHELEDLEDFIRQSLLDKVYSPECEFDL